MFMLKKTHLRILTEQVKADDTRLHKITEEHEAKLVAFKALIVEQAAHENKHLRQEAVELRNQIAVLNGKLVHHIDNPEEPRLATSGLAGEPR